MTPVSSADLPSSGLRNPARRIGRARGQRVTSKTVQTANLRQIWRHECHQVSPSAAYLLKNDGIKAARQSSAACPVLERGLSHAPATGCLAFS